MPVDEEVQYSRDAVIRAIHDYESFLVRMYMSPSRMAEPPATGWPKITIDRYRAFGKTDEVVELLRRLPIITGETHNPWNTRPHCAGNDSQFYDFTFEGRADPRQPLSEDQGERLRGQTQGSGKWVPPHVLGLISGSESRARWLLDTKNGTIRWIECPFDLVGAMPNDTESELEYNVSEDFDQVGNQDGEQTDDEASGSDADAVDNESFGSSGDQPDLDEDQSDRDEEDNYSDDNTDGDKTWNISDFFQLLKKQFRTLRWVPISDKIVLDPEYEIEQDMLQEVRGIWREHGWPEAEADGTFDKEACLAHIRSVVEEKYPDRAGELDAYP